MSTFLIEDIERMSGVAALEHATSKLAGPLSSLIFDTTRRTMLPLSVVALAQALRFCTAIYVNILGLQV